MSTVLEMPLRAQVGGLAATLAVLCGLLVAMIAVGARGPAPSALWNAAGEDSIRLRSQALGDLDDAEVRETAQLPVPGVHRVFREDADHQRNYEGSYVSDNSIGLQVDALAGRAGRQQMLYQRGSWHALNPVRVLRADANFGYPTVKQPSRTKKAAPPADHFFGLQHWGFGSSALARAHPVFARTQQLHEQAKTSSFIDITQPDKTDADGYVDAGAYSSQLAANAVKGQGAYIANWHAKNLKAGKQMVRDAAKLYAKWDLVDPTTGRSKPNMVIPQNRDDSDYEDTARAPRLRLFQNGPMLTDAHLMMLKEVKADNGRTYVLPWYDARCLLARVPSQRQSRVFSPDCKINIKIGGALWCTRRPTAMASQPGSATLVATNTRRGPGGMAGKRQWGLQASRVWIAPILGAPRLCRMTRNGPSGRDHASPKPLPKPRHQRLQLSRFQRRKQLSWSGGRRLLQKMNQMPGTRRRRRRKGRGKQWPQERAQAARQQWRPTPGEFLRWSGRRGRRFWLQSLPRPLQEEKAAGSCKQTT